jgi:septum formation protein
MDERKHSIRMVNTTIKAPAITTKDVILASNSPRRRELLQNILPAFSIAPSRDVDESYPDTLPAHQVAEYLSRKKAEAYKNLIADNTLLITADTVVLCDGKILGKPHSAEQAKEMLRSLSGKEHSVTTGVTVKTATETTSLTEETFVTFATLSEAEIEAYINVYMPYDKAGAYGIQEWIGCIGITGIKGCFYNVMGLPLHRLYRTIISAK